jgi:hypothetical protein
MLGLSFEGLSNQDNRDAFGFRVSPPDTVGDVGPNHYVQQVNLLVRVWDKSGNPLTPPFKLSRLWKNLGGQCAASDVGDSIVVYDPLADRWILSQFAFANMGDHSERDRGTRDDEDDSDADYGSQADDIDLGTVSFTFRVHTPSPIATPHTFSSGNLSTPIPDLTTIEIPLTVPALGPRRRRQRTGKAEPHLPRGSHN